MAQHSRLWRSIVAVALLLQVACGDGGDDPGGDRSNSSDHRRGDILAPDRDAGEVGRLVPFVANAPINPDVVGGSPLPPVEPDLRDLRHMVVAADGALWARVPMPGSGPEPRVSVVLLKATAETVETVDIRERLQSGRDLGVGPDDTVYLVSRDWELLRYHDGQITRTGHRGVEQLFGPTAGPDGTVYLEDPLNEQVVAVGPDGAARTVLAGVDVGLMTVGPDGTLYYADRDTGGVRAMAPSGDVRDVAGFGDDEPTEGGSAIDASIGTAGLVASDDGLYLLFANTVWRVDDEGRLHLVLRRRWHEVEAGHDDNDIRLYQLAAGGGQVYVWDDADGSVIYRVEPDE